jgi:hypothetical protein
MPRHPDSRLVKFSGSGCFSGLQEFRDYEADAGRQDGPKGGQEYGSQRIEVTGTGILGKEAGHPVGVSVSHHSQRFPHFHC